MKKKTKKGKKARRTKVSEYDRIIEALNLIDEQANQSGLPYEDEVLRFKAYEVVADFIDEKAKRS